MTNLMNDHGQLGDRLPRVSIRRRIAAGAVACIVLVSAAVLTSTPGEAAPRSKPKPTATATPNPVPSPTRAPTPAPSPTSSPTPTPTPTTPPSPMCDSMTTYGAVEYCVTTLTAIGTGKHAVGTAVVVRGTWVLEVNGSQVTLGRDDCPPGMFCGTTLATLEADFSNVQPAPTVDSLIDVYSEVTAGWSLIVDGYH